MKVTIKKSTQYGNQNEVETYVAGPVLVASNGTTP